MNAARLFSSLTPGILALLVLAGAPAAPARAQSLLHTFRGLAQGDQLGSEAGPGDVGGAGDLDGDGHADLIAGTWSGGSSFEGYARAWSGRTGAVLWHFTGAQAGDGLGMAVDGAGDVNGDGVPDLVVGAPGSDFNGQDSGSVYVFSGADSSILHRFDGDFAGDQYGATVAGAGDVNRDGRADVLAGSFGGPPNGLGYAKVHSGANGATLIGSPGGRVAPAGDVNGDGFDDVLVGSPRETVNGLQTGRLRVLSGADGSTLHQFDGDFDGARFAFAVGPAGDLDADGYCDFAASALIGVYARVYSGADGSVLLDLPGVGARITGVGDMDGDSVPDLIVTGTHDAGVSSGRVLSGADGSTLFTLYGDAYSEFFWHVASAGDVNADGLGDLIVGGMHSATPELSTGLVQVIGAAPPLRLEPPAPCVAGAPNTLTVRDATPGNTVLFVCQLFLRTSRIPCANGMLLVPAGGLHGRAAVRRVRADATGRARFTKLADPLLTGRTLRVQAVEWESCRFSEVLTCAFP